MSAIGLLLMLPSVAVHAEQRHDPVEEMRSFIREERKRLAALPPPMDDSERLIRMGETDQRLRRQFRELDLSAVAPSDVTSVRIAIWEIIGEVDREHQAALLEMLPGEGWFLANRYGVEAARAAFLIVQHSDAELWRKFVPILEKLARTGEIDGQQFALMYDRFAISEGRRQRFGTQVLCREGKWIVPDVEDPEKVDALRSEFGVPFSFAWQKSRYSGRGC